tara:strand:- start:412 stop:654 length:243 start_codon:yes stop_codon:yes gene_type:complete
MSDLNKFSTLVDEIWEMIFGTPRKSKNNPAFDKEMAMMYTKEKPKRARTDKGRYRGDNLATEHINEAWVGGKAPKRKRKK